MSHPTPDPVFRALAGNLQSGALLVDARGTVLDVNQAFSGLVGRSPGECVGVGIPHAWWADDERLAELIAGVASGEAPDGHAHARLHGPSGSADVYVEASGVSAARDGERTGHLGAVLLVRLLKAGGLDVEFIATHVGDVIAAHDAEGRFTFVGEACRDLYGLAPAQLIGRDPIGLLAREEDRASLRGALRRLRSGESADESVSFRAFRADGTEVAVDLNACAVRDAHGALTSIASVARDATARLVAEREVARDAARRSRLRAAEQAALMRIAMAAATEGDAEAVLDTVAMEVAGLLDVGGALVCRSEGPGVTVVGQHGSVAGAEVGDWIPEASIPGFRAAGGASTLEPESDRPPARLVGASLLAAPVATDGRPWGAVIAVVAADAHVPPSVARRLKRFCEVVGVAIGAADARRRLAAQAVTDALTGLANHRAFQERLRAEVARAQRHGRELSLAVLDLDHFKSLNDVCGHQEGDRALAEVARRLAHSARSGDLVARVGGEEFAWILPETDGVNALRAADRARELIGDEPLDGGQRITISAGVCDLAWAKGADELYRLADQALYWAKANGRDQICAYSSDVSEPLSAEERAEWLARSHQVAALRALVQALDARLPGAWLHAERVADVAGEIAIEMGWSTDAVTSLRQAALLHDVGLVADPAALLDRDGDAASSDKHTIIGAEIARDALSSEQCDWIRFHHERLDGTGYPDGLAGEGVPEGAAILAVAEAWDEVVGGGGGVVSPDDALDRMMDERTRFLPGALDALAALRRREPARSGRRT